MQKSLSLFAIAAIASMPLSAQTVETLPKGKAAAEGSASRHIPLRYTPARIQNGFGSDAVTWAATKVITSLTMRKDRIAYLNAALSTELRVWLSRRGANVTVPNNKYAANHGSDVREFMKKKAYNWAAFTRGTTLAPFDIVLKGDTPFVATTPNLIVDIASYQAANGNNTNFYVDADRAANVGTRGRSLSFGTPCNPTNFWNYATGYEEGSQFRTYCYTRTAGDVVLMWLSPKRVAIPIPGLTGCSLYADFTAPGTIFYPSPITSTGTSGYANFVWGTVPTGFKGNQVISQGVAFSTAGVRFTRGQETTFGDLRPAYTTGHRYNYGRGTTNFNPDTDDATFGWAGQAIIFKVN